MAVSKFAIACVAAVLAGGATAGLASSDDISGPAVQVTNERPVTAIGAVTDPALLQNVPVRFVSGQGFGRVVAVATDARGRASRIQVALDGMPGTKLWLDRSDLVYSRSQDAIVAHDVHAPSIAVASR